MKKVLSFLLALCMLIPLAMTAGAGSAFAAAAKTPEEFEALKQAAEGGDASAMAEVGNIYLRGNYNLDVTRDFNQALSWFLRAADAGNTDVYMSIANIYEKGSSGERNPEKAYTWFKRAADAGVAEAEERMAEPIYAAYRWNDDAAHLTGTLGEYGMLGGRFGTPFYLDKPLVDCPRIDLTMSFISYRGWPFGLYGLYALTPENKWVEVTRFQIEKYQAAEDAEPRTYEIHPAQPLTCSALAVVLLEDGMDFNLVRDDRYLVDSAFVGEYSESFPAPVFTPSDAEYPENASSVYTTAYVNPYPSA